MPRAHLAAAGSLLGLYFSESSEIKDLLQVDRDLGSDKIAEAMKTRLLLITDQIDQLIQQRKQIEEILISLEKKSELFKAQQRRAIMSFYGKVSVVVTGCAGLEKTAKFIQRHFQSAYQNIPIIQWQNEVPVNQEKPYILVIKEADLVSSEIDKIHSDIVVIKSLGTHSDENQKNYQSEANE